MTNNRWGRSSKIAGLLVAVAASGCAVAVDNASEEALGVKQEEILNGSNMAANTNMVAIYGRTTSTCTPNADDQARGFTLPYTLNNAWKPRPCSGIVIRKDGSDNYILTARHCVTVDGEEDGTPFTGSTNLRSISTLNPGPLSTVESNGSMTVTGTPPAFAINTSVHYSNFATYGDLAIVKATGSLQPTAAALRPGVQGFSSTARSNFLNTQLTTQGYGRNLNGYCYSHAISGAGRLRLGSPFGVTSANMGLFGHVTTNASGQQVWGGDSGGPLYASHNINGTLYPRIFGVNHSASVGSGGEMIVDFVQAAFGYVYLVQLDSLPGNTVLGVVTVEDGAVVRTGQTGGGTTQRMTIDRANGYLKIGGKCLNDEYDTTGSAVRLRTCGGATTKWNINPGGSIVSRTGGHYLTTSVGLLMSEPTPAIPTKFVFVADTEFN
jgi:hypothetical protein